MLRCVSRQKLLLDRLWSNIQQLPPNLVIDNFVSFQRSYGCFIACPGTQRKLVHSVSGFHALSPPALRSRVEGEKPPRQEEFACKPICFKLPRVCCQQVFPGKNFISIQAELMFQ